MKGAVDPFQQHSHGLNVPLEELCTLAGQRRDSGQDSQEPAMWHCDVVECSRAVDAGRHYERTAQTIQ